LFGKKKNATSAELDASKPKGFFGKRSANKAKTRAELKEKATEKKKIVTEGREPEEAEKGTTPPTPKSIEQKSSQTEDDKPDTPKAPDSPVENIVPEIVNSEAEDDNVASVAGAGDSEKAPVEKVASFASKVTEKDAAPSEPVDPPAQEDRAMAEEESEEVHSGDDSSRDMADPLATCKDSVKQTGIFCGFM
jgi:hypothetical protein